jgi:hypothetical protein
MNTYIVSVNLQVEVQAFNEEDAFEAVEDVFGTGDTCGLNVMEFTVNEHTKL